MRTNSLKQLQRLADKIQKGLDSAEEVNLQELPRGLVPMINILPPARHGDSKIEHYEVTKDGAALHNLRCAINGTSDMSIVPGRYVRLIVGKDLMMSDAPYEARSNRDLLEAARGDVLIAGLGMGMVLLPILLKKGVHSVQVVEKNPNVVTLVKPHIEEWHEHQGIIGAKPAPLQITKSDIFEYEPTKKFDVIYFDIWPCICIDNLKDAQKLKSKFRKYLKPKGWMGVWVEADLRRRKKIEDQMLKRVKEFRLMHKKGWEEDQ